MKENSIKKFLEFNGKKLYFLSVKGTWWIAIKPICEALGVDYIRQFKNLKEYQLLSQLLSEQTIVAADGRLRKMVCLPEKKLYGWLFRINSDSPQLIDYQDKCFEILYDYFHPPRTEETVLLKEETLDEIELKRLLELKAAEIPVETELDKQIAALRNKIKQNRKTRKALEKEFISKQLPLWQSEEINKLEV